MNWHPLTTNSQLSEIHQQSFQLPCLIFKHSTRCNISSIAKFRLEADWDFSQNEISPYYLDLIAFRKISDSIAEKYAVYHESPQILVIAKGECIFDASHLDITVSELKEVFQKA